MRDTKGLVGPSKAGGPASAGVILDMWESNGGGGSGGAGESSQDEDQLSVLLLHGGTDPELRILVFDHMEASVISPGLPLECGHGCGTEGRKLNLNSFPPALGNVMMSSSTCAMPLS